MVGSETIEIYQIFNLKLLAESRFTPNITNRRINDLSTIDSLKQYFNDSVTWVNPVNTMSAYNWKSIAGDGHNTLVAVATDGKILYSYDNLLQSPPGENWSLLLLL